MTRRADLADAAIATLAARGMRGLTHRAVDQAAGVAEGSTSYYFRTRQALLQAVVERLADLDIAEVPVIRPGDLGAFADAAVDLVRHLLTTGRERQVARYELALEATRRPELRNALVTAGARIRTLTAEVFRSAGVGQPESRAHDFVAFIDGLLFDQIAGAGNRELSAGYLRSAIRSLLSALTGTELTGTGSCAAGGG